MSATSPLPPHPAIRQAVPIRRTGTSPRLGRQLERLGIDESTLRAGAGPEPATTLPSRAVLLVVLALLAALALTLVLVR